VKAARRYLEWPARRGPRDSVACTWAAWPSEAAAGQVLPDACIDIIWDGSSLFVAGPDTGPVAIDPHPATSSPTAAGRSHGSRPAMRLAWSGAAS